MQFSKMHGLSNDFIIINAINQKVILSSDLIRNLSNRHLGIGFDQLLLVEPAFKPKTDFHYRIFNADGSEASQCGNGARCFAKFVLLKNLIKKNRFIISTKNRNLELHVISKDLIKVNMGEPHFQPDKIPFYSKKISNFYIKKITNKKIKFSVVSVGNPHCVIFIKDINNISIKDIGIDLNKKYYFPEGINVSFVEKINEKKIRLRVYERGIGETNACGSAACAAVAVGIKNNLLSNKEKIVVELLGGILYISWKGKKGSPIFMIGPATHVYDGNIKI